MVKKRRKRKVPATSFGKKVYYVSIAILVMSLVLIGYNFYKKLFKGNIADANTEDQYLHIPTGSSFDDVLDILEKEKLLLDRETFEWTAEMLEYTNDVKAGRYEIRKNMSNSELISLLKSGKQSPVRLTFNNLRLKAEFAGLIGKSLEPDSTEIMALLEDESFLEPYGFNRETVYTMFIPNTYELFWNTDAESFFKRMHQEYQRFWDEERLAKAKEVGLSPMEVSILASIVDQETMQDSEMPVIAGVYLNRLKNNQRLEADPTVVFAGGDFSVKRVQGEMLSNNSPYNTYKYKGLPPGPISMASIAATDAVLNYKKHNYFYFCAKEDFSGFHNFSETYEQHKIYAKRFRDALNKRNIN